MEVSMGGKRPDQHRIAPAEGGSTDYKRYPEATHGKDEDLDTTGDKQRLAQSMKDSRAQPFLPDVPEPSAEANRARKLTDVEAEPGAGDTETRKEDPLA
jgi:hypothetical protein